MHILCDGGGEKKKTDSGTIKENSENQTNQKQQQTKQSKFTKLKVPSSFKYKLKTLLHVVISNPRVSNIYQVQFA